MVTVKELADNARRDMAFMARHFPKRADFFQAVADCGDDLAAHWVTRFYYRQAPNPTQNQLDKLLVALQRLREDRAA